MIDQPIRTARSPFIFLRLWPTCGQNLLAISRILLFAGIITLLYNHRRPAANRHAFFAFATTTAATGSEQLTCNSLY